MRKATLAVAVLGVMFGTGAVSAKGKSVTGIWTMTVEQQFGLRLELAQDKNALTGRLDWPHGDPIKLVGAVKGDTVTFSGDSSGENFTVHVDSTVRSRRMAPWRGRSRPCSWISMKRTRLFESTIRRFHGRPSVESTGSSTSAAD